MRLFNELRLLLRITGSQAIARRYFVTNGFDGALAMLGLTMGFHVSGEVAVATALSACFGTAVALLMSGLTSAYVSESAERRRELHELEQAMMVDLGNSAHGRAARWVPLLIAAVNGLAPFGIALLIMGPLVFAHFGVGTGLQPLETSIAVAFVAIFLLGLFLGRISGVFWLWAGLRTLLIAGVTALLILLLKI